MALLQDLAARLTVPGLPDWTGLLALLLLLLAGLAYLLMPFSVFGLKGRLESIEAQLDEIQAEIRTLALRLPDMPRRTAASEDWIEPPTPRAPRRAEEAAEPRDVPPIPPPPAWPERSRDGRAEPRLDWPRG